MVHITVIQACPLARSLSGSGAGCPRGSRPAGCLGKRSLQRYSNWGQAAGERCWEMRRQSSALRGSGGPRRGAGGERGGVRSAFHQPRELPSDELFPEPPSVHRWKFKKRDDGRGIEGARTILNVCARRRPRVGPAMPVRWPSGTCSRGSLRPLAPARRP